MSDIEKFVTERLTAYLAFPNRFVDSKIHEAVKNAVQKSGGNDFKLQNILPEIINNLVIAPGDKFSIKTKNPVFSMLANAAKRKIDYSEVARELIDELYMNDNPDDSNNTEIPTWLVNQYEERAAAERDAGTTIEINYGIPYVAIDYPNGESYFFQGDEADDLLNEVPDNINEEDYILAISQNW